MEAKVYNAGFDIAEFNDFTSKNIIYRFSPRDDGGILIMFKDPSKLGNTTMEKIEEVDRLCKQSQNEILAATLNKQHVQGLLDDAQAKLNDADPKSKEWDALDAEVKGFEHQIKRDQATIDERAHQLDTFLAYGKELLKELE